MSIQKISFLVFGQILVKQLEYMKKNQGICMHFSAPKSLNRMFIISNFSNLVVAITILLWGCHDVFHASRLVCANKKITRIHAACIN